MKTFPQPEPLTEAEFDRLGNFLESCKGGKAMNVEAQVESPIIRLLDSLQFAFFEVCCRDESQSSPKR
jgi:hypothetical protein